MQPPLTSSPSLPNSMTRGATLEKSEISSHGNLVRLTAASAANGANGVYRSGNTATTTTYDADDRHRHLSSTEFPSSTPPSTPFITGEHLSFPVPCLWPLYAGALLSSLVNRIPSANSDSTCRRRCGRPNLPLPHFQLSSNSFN